MRLTERSGTFSLATFCWYLVALLAIFLPCSATPVAAGVYAVPPDGLVAFYDLAGNAVDSSLNGNDGILHGSLATYDRFGQAGGALYLNNSLSDGVELPGTVISGTTLTVNFWISTADASFGLISGANATYYNEYLLFVYDTGFDVTYHNGIAVSPDSSIDINDGRWRMVTVITEPTQTRIYLDGVLVKTSTSSLAAPLSVQALWIGQEQDSLNGGFDPAQTMGGRIDDLSIHNRVLTPVEIINLYGGYDPGTIVGGVGFPGGIASFADQVVSFSPGPQTIPPYTSPQTALGPADYVGSDNGLTYVSLGWGGELVVRFTDNALTTSGDPANDLWIFEIGSAVEPNYISISEDGVSWIELGLIQGATRGVDIDAFTGSGVVPGTKYYFVKIVDGNAHLSSSPFGGADIDAVGAIESTANSHWISAFPVSMLTPGDVVTLRAESSATGPFTYLWSVDCPDLSSQPTLSGTTSSTVQWTVSAFPGGVTEATCTTSVTVTDPQSNTVTPQYIHQIVTADNRVDTDTDGIYDHQDNCPLVSNVDQADADDDFVGDVCDPDDDNDGVADTTDNCPFVANPDQKDTNGNGIGNACDTQLLPYLLLLGD